MQSIQDRLKNASSKELKEFYKSGILPKDSFQKYLDKPVCEDFVSINGNESKNYEQLYNVTLDQRIRFSLKIDEQSELIKEMRYFIDVARYNNPYDEVKAHAILDKTKEYAE